MRFVPYVHDMENHRVLVQIEPMTTDDAIATTRELRSDAAWYCEQNSEEDRYYSFFFHYCRKYKINWASATDKEKQFIEEITRISYERDKAKRLGLPPASVLSSFTV